MQNQEDPTKDEVVFCGESSEHSVLNGSIPNEVSSNSLTSKVGCSSTCEQTSAVINNFNPLYQPNSNLSSIPLTNTMSTTIDSSIIRSDSEWKHDLSATQYRQTRNNEHFIRELPSIGEDSISSSLSSKNNSFRPSSLPSNIHNFKRKLSSDLEAPLLPEIVDEQNIYNSSCEPLAGRSSEGTSKEPPAWASCYSPYRKRTTSVVSSERGIDSLVNKLFNDDQRQRFLALKMKKKGKLAEKEKSKFKSVDRLHQSFTNTIGKFSLTNLKDSKNEYLLTKSSDISQNIDRNIFSAPTNFADLVLKSNDPLGISEGISSQSMEVHTFESLKKPELVDDSNFTEKASLITNDSSSNPKIVPDPGHHQNVEPANSSSLFQPQNNILIPADISTVDSITSSDDLIISPLTEEASMCTNETPSAPQTTIPETFHQPSVKVPNAKVSFQIEGDVTMSEDLNVLDSNESDDLVISPFTENSNLIGELSSSSSHVVPETNYQHSLVPSNSNVSFQTEEAVSVPANSTLDSTSFDEVDDFSVASDIIRHQSEDTGSATNISNVSYSLSKTPDNLDTISPLHSTSTISDKTQHVLKESHSEDFNLEINQSQAIKMVDNLDQSSINSVILLEDSIEKMDASDSENTDSCTSTGENEDNFVINEVISTDSQIHFQEDENNKENEQSIGCQHLLNTEGEQLINIESEHLVSTESELIINTESDQLISLESEHLLNIENEQLINTESDQLGTLESGQLVNTESEKLVNTESEQLADVENEQLIQMPIIYLENEGDLIFVDENGVILDSELVNSLLNISVDQLKTQILQSGNEGQFITIHTDSVQEDVLPTDSISSAPAYELENSELTAVSVKDSKDVETSLCLEGDEYRIPIGINSTANNSILPVTEVGVVNNYEHLTLISTDLEQENVVPDTCIETDGNGENTTQYGESGTHQPIVTIDEGKALDDLMKSLVGNRDINYTQDLNFQQDSSEKLANGEQIKVLPPHLKTEAIFTPVVNGDNDSRANKGLSLQLGISNIEKESAMEIDSDLYPASEIKDQTDLLSEFNNSAMDHTTSEANTLLNSKTPGEEVASTAPNLEIEVVEMLEEPVTEIVPNRKARKSWPVNRHSSIDSNSNSYNSPESCDRHSNTDSSSSLDGRPSKRPKLSKLSKGVRKKSDLAEKSVKTKCTAMKTFVKPFTVAKKSFTEKTAFKSVIQSYFGVRTAKKTCSKANQGLQKTAGSAVIISFQDKGDIDSPEEVLTPTRSWSPLQELRFKSSCHCSADEVPCLCNGDELQLICEAEDTIDENTIPCTKSVSHQYLLTPSSEIRHRAFCDVHMHRLRKHHCCPKCGIFCTQGAFLHCSYVSPLRGGKESHFFHPNCFLIPDVGLPPSCPHCCKFSDFNHIQLSLVENTNPEDISQTLTQLKGENLTSFLENYMVLMTNTSKEKESLTNGDATVALQNQELKKMLMAVTRDKALRLRPTGKCLFNPIKTGDVKKVLQLIGNGVDPNHKFEFHKNNTPLHIAAFYGLTGIVHVLLQYGAHIDAVNDDLETPLFLAVEKNQLAVARYLIFAGAQTDVKNEHGLTAFHLASKHNAKEIAKLLFSTGNFDINLQDDGGWTPLVWACEHNHVDLVKWLLELGADPNVRDNEENTAMHWAACSGDGEALELLLQNESNISFVNERGDSALHIAARKDNFVGVRLLLARDASTECKNKDGETPTVCCDPGTKSVQILRRHIKKCSMYNKSSLPPHVAHRDISRGAESYPIQAVNEVDAEEFLMEFRYITRNCYAPNISVVATVDSMKVCHCKNNCHTHECACTKISRCWYDLDGRLVSDFDLIDPPSIYECNKTCHCPKTCLNRVVQRGLRLPLQLFRTLNRGWGIRTLKSLPKGTFVCEYIGEIVTEKEIAEREDDSYLFDLESKDGDFCLDGKFYGNVARYINHSCEPNLVSIRAFIEHQDQNFPRIAFFTMKDIQALEELCFDYGTDFWIAKSQTILCTCNSSLCKFSKDTIDDTLLAYAKDRERMAQNQTGASEALS